MIKTALQPAYPKCLICGFKIAYLRSLIRYMGMEEKDNPYKHETGGFFSFPTLTIGLRDTISGSCMQISLSLVSAHGAAVTPFWDPMEDASSPGAQPHLLRDIKGQDEVAKTNKWLYHVTVQVRASLKQDPCRLVGKAAFQGRLVAPRGGSRPLGVSEKAGPQQATLENHLSFIPREVGL